MGALYRIVNEDPPRPANAGWLAPLLVRSLVKDPDERWSAAQARDFLFAGPPLTEHPESLDDAPVTRTTTLETVAATALEPAPVPAAAPARRRAPRALVLTAVLAVLVLTGIALAIGLTSGDDPRSTPAEADETSSSPTGQPVTASKQEMEAFVVRYLATVVEDPEAAFEMLTPEFQEASDGIEGYRGFWDTVARTELLTIQADPETMVVDYRYTYVVRGEGPQTDDVSLRLQQTEDGRYLIAGEA
jgi:hypothetical protein